MKRRQGTDGPPGVRPGETRERALQALEGVLDGEADPIVGMATVSSILKQQFDAWIWVGFYRIVAGVLVVGPYQGRVACVRFPLDQGVCGRCVTEGRSVVVPDVEEFHGHITCDPEAVSEVVVPVRDRSGAIRGVLDVDSDRPAAFTDQDVVFLERVAELLSRCDW